jgi:hypothetical protein
MRPRLFVLALLACCVPAAVLAGKSTYVFTSFDVPGATFSSATSVNHGGDIAGWCTGGAYAYTSSTGTFTQFQFPGSGGTIAWGMNDGGDVVGQ